MKNCYKEPMPILTWPKNCDYVMFIDENNISNLSNRIKNKLNKNISINLDEKFFTITGCIFSKCDYEDAEKIINNIKLKYFDNENVCFHSYDIRNKHGVFKLDDKYYSRFIIDLDNVINNSNYSIISISINIPNYIINNCYTQDIYSIAFDFLLERYIYFIEKDKKGAIILEARGKKEDRKLLHHISKIINISGTTYINTKGLSKKIEGVYFNPKFNVTNHKSFVGLEFADLSSYPIHKYIKYQKKDKAFKTLEKKLYNYPNYKNKGIKIYP